MPDGVYNLAVAAFDANGDRISDVSVTVGGRVTGVELSNGQAIVEIGGMKVPASRIIRLRELPADPVEQPPVTNPVDEEEDEPEAVS